MSQAVSASQKEKEERRANKREQDQPDAAYIKREEVGVVVAKGLAVMYKVQPKNPVDFLSKWLLNYAQVEKQAMQGDEHQGRVKDLKTKLEYQESVQRTEVEHQRTEQEKEDQATRAFWDKINFSADLTDQLQDLADYLKGHTSATAVYIGKLVQPKRAIAEDDDDQAHEDASRNPIIHFLHSTKSHEYLVDQKLEQEQGLTFDVFKDEEVQQDERILEEGEEGYEEQQARLRAKANEEVLPRHIYVQEVVREPRMHFFKVPKLGSYMAIRLEYESCLFEDSLAAAVQDYIEVKHKQKEQDEEKRLYYEKLEEERLEAENEGVEFKHEEKQWEDIKPQPFLTRKIQFVVCLNTMGQDREFTETEKKMALRTVRDYRDRWEEVERENLQSDIVRRVKRIQFDKDYREHYEQADAHALEKRVEEKLIPKEGEEALDDDAKALLAKKHRFKLLTKAFYFNKEAKANKKPKFQVK